MSPESRNIAELLKLRAQLDAQLEQFQRLVTVMFTDIAGSTKYFDEHGDLAGMAMVQECNDCLAPLVKKHSGTIDRKSTRLNSSHIQKSRMPSSA